LVHRWRAQTSAIIVGGRTVVEDDPALTTRLWPGPNPRPVIIDLRNRCTGQERLFNGVGEPPLVFASRERPDLRAEVIVLKEQDLLWALPQVLGALSERRYGQVTVEGGAAVLSAFLEEGLWEEARVFIGQVRFETGVPAPKLSSSPNETSTIGTDTLALFKPKQAAKEHPN